LSDRREDAWKLVCEYVKDPGLRRHMRSVSSAMGFYARELGEDAAEWETVGLIHDFDWEIHPDHRPYHRNSSRQTLQKYRRCKAQINSKEVERSQVCRWR